MAQPLPYERDFSFTGFQSGHPKTPLPGDKVDLELDQVAATFDEVLVRIALLQRDDLALANNSVGYDQLKDEVVLGFQPPSMWTTATIYAARDTVFFDTGFYRCLIAHTSNVFATDLAAGDWELLADFSTAITAAGVMLQSIYDPQGKAADAFARVNHTGTQLAATISDFSAAADARIAAAVGSVVQAYDADLTAWAGVNPAAYLNAAGIAAAYQPLDSDLTAIAALATTATGRALLTIANAAAGFDSLAPTTTRGDLIFRNATTNARLAASTAGYLLQTNGAGTDPTWSGFTQPTSGSPATRTWQSKAADIVDLRDWSGLDLTGATDMATLVQAAINATAAAGQTLKLPAGKIRLDSAITVPAGANIQGPGLPSDRNGTFSAYNCYFYLNHLGVGFNLTGTGTGRRIAGFGTYRNQPAAGGGWTPVAASYDIQVFGVYDAIIEDIFLYNATKGILVTGDTVTPAGNGRLTIQNIRGQAMQLGLVMTHVYDVCYIDNIHFWPFWSFDSNITGYQKANGTAFLFKRMDNCIMGRLFQYGMQAGITIDQQATVGLDGTLPPGSVSLLHIDAFGSDNCRIGLNVASGAAATFSIDEFYAVNSAAESFNLIDIAGSNTKGFIKNIFGARTNLSLISLNTGSGIELTVGQSRSLAIDNDANGTPEFNVSAGNKLTLLAPPVTTAATVYSSTGDIFPRGTIPDRQIATVTGSTVALNNAVTTQQNIFVAANDTLTLLGSTLYRFRAKIGLNTGAVSHATRFSITGTATFTDIDYQAIASNGPAATPNATTLRRVESAAQSTVVAANTNVTTDIWIEGTFRTNAAGTIVPQIDFTVAPTGTCEVTIGSFFEVEKIGPASATALGNWS